MHQRRWLHIVAVLLGLALVGAACGNDDGTTETGAGEGIRVGLVYDIGGRGDQSFNDAAFAGLSQAQDELGVEVRDLEPAGTGEDREELLRTLADEGYDMIIGVGFAFEEAIGAAAADYPDITFAIVDMVVEADNVTSLVFAEEQGSFLVGAAAALTSEAGHIGFIGGVEIDLIQKFEAGYMAGAEAADPDVSVTVQYISQPPDFAGFNDPARGREIALGQFADGADVIYHAAGGSGGGLFEAALETSTADEKAWAIGVDSDQYFTAEEEVREYILTSMLKRVDVAVFDAIASFVDGDLEGGVRVYDLANDGVGYSTSGDFLASDVIERLEELRQQIVDGEIEVPTSP